MGEFNVYCLLRPTSVLERDKTDLTDNEKITDNHKSRKQALRVDDDS